MQGKNHTQPTLAEQPASILVIAAWFALLAGLGQVAGLAVSKFLLGRYIHRGVNAVWMAPLAELFIVAIPALILVLLARRWPGLASLGVVVFVCAFPGFVSLLLMVPRLQRYAALLLAAGLAAQTARLVVDHPRGFYTLVRYTLGWVGFLSNWWNRIFSKKAGFSDGAPGAAPTGGTTEAVLPLNRREFLLGAGATLAGLAAGTRGWQALAERRAFAKLPPAPAVVSPNVLLIVLDTVRAQSLSLHGYGRRTTPQLERLAQRGVCFERAVAAAPWTLASHASMFTGRYPHELSVGWTKPLDATYPTLAEALSAQGYAAAGFVANTLYCSAESGLNRGFPHYDDFPITPGEIARNSSLVGTIIGNDGLRRLIGYYQAPGRKSAAEINGDFLRWLGEGRQNDRPFFAFLNYFDAHHPYLPPPPYDTKFGPPLRRVDPMLATKQTWSPEGVQAEQDAYDGAIANLDHLVGLLFDELERVGWLQNTLAIITSDHGEEFYEHGLMSHGDSLYLPSLYVPLLISFPSRVPAGRRVSRWVTLRDLPATVTDLLGLEGGMRFPGDSLARYWSGRGESDEPAAAPLLAEVNSVPSSRKWIPVSRGDMKSLVVERYHYILNGDGQEELYDIVKDPWEQRDLASSEGGILERLRSSLDQILGGKQS